MPETWSAIPDGFGLFVVAALNTTLITSNAGWVSQIFGSIKWSNAAALGAGKRFGPRLLFENADWLITPTEKTALVGANGAGKSTLMKVLGGMDSLDYGSVQRMKGMTIGYLPQDGLAWRGERFLRSA